jgi:hypothetical protein
LFFGFFTGDLLMPQPYFGSWTSDQNSLAQRPHLAAHVGIIASLWSHVEYRLALLIARILHIDAEVATIMYLPVKSEAARLAIIEAIAKDRLPKELLLEFQTLRKRIGSTGAERDNIVHGLWALPGNGNDSVLWYDATKSVKSVSETISHLARRTEEMREKSITAKEFLDSVLEYKEQDFIAIETRIQERIGEIMTFGQKIPMQFPSQ